MKVLHLLYAGGIGGIEKLCRDISKYSFKDENTFFFVHESGMFYNDLKNSNADTILYRYSNIDFFKLSKKINELINDLNIDIVIAHHPSPLIWLSLLFLKRNSRYKIFLYAHNNYDEITSRRYWKRLIYNRLLNKCHGVIAISKFVKTSIVSKSGINEEKVFVAYNGVKVSNYSVRYKNIDENTIQILYVGRLIKEKGVQVLIEALSNINNNLKCYLTVVGDGPYRLTLENMTKKFQLNDYIKFVGNQINVSKYLKNTDIFVHPAIWEEGFGITIIEAMSIGLPCIAFNKGAIPEIIEDGKSGFIVQECNAKSLADKIKEVAIKLNNDELEKIRKAAIDRANHFSIETLVDTLHNIYQC